MKRPEYRDDGSWVVHLDDYTNGFIFLDAKSAWDFFEKFLASGLTEAEWLEENR
jgi:hypothetical protein